MRQLLWREQCMERERGRGGGGGGRAPPPPPPPTPALTIPPSQQEPEFRLQDIPNEVYKIETRLENPTAYHMLESQKRQVAEYLSEGSAPDGSCREAGSSGAVAPPPAPPSRRVSQPFSPPSVSSAATSPSEYANSEVCDDYLEDTLLSLDSAAVGSGDTAQAPTTPTTT